MLQKRRGNAMAINFRRTKYYMFLIMMRRCYGNGFSRKNSLTITLRKQIHPQDNHLDQIHIFEVAKGKKKRALVLGVWKKKIAESAE